MEGEKEREEEKEEKRREEEEKEESELKQKNHVGTLGHACHSSDPKIYQDNRSKHRELMLCTCLFSTPC